MIDKRYLRTSRGLVHCQEAGEGGDVLVLITVTSFGNVLLDAVLPALARSGWHAIGLDLMGYGRSDKRDAVWLVEDFADNIAEALDARGVQPKGLVCGHFSSWIGVELASRQPAWPARLVLDGTPFFDAAKRAGNLSRPTPEPQRWTEDGAHALEYWKRAYGIVHRLDPETPMPPVPSTRFREAYLAVLESLSFEPGTTEAANRFDLEAKAAEIRRPVLLMCSDFDWNLPHHASLKRMFPEAVEKRWPGTHPLHELGRPGRAAEYVEAIAAFMEPARKGHDAGR